MAIRYPLVLNGSQIQELQEGDVLAGSSEVPLLADRANFIRSSDSQYRAVSVSTPEAGDPNTVPCRDSNGDINSRRFNGIATSALFADLAEKYLPDQDYEIGTVVCVGGDAEITACNRGDRAFGAISANPAFMMNEGLEGGVYVALKGRVPVRINGPVNKGDRLIACENGCAGVASAILRNRPISAGSFPDTFAIALETNLDPGVKLVECIIL